MQTPIRISQHPELGAVVSGRELYSLIAVSTAVRDIFSDWFRDKQHIVGLVEGKDFAASHVVLPGKSRKSIEFILTLEAAKQIAGLASRNRGAGVIAYINEYQRLDSEPLTHAPNTEPAPAAEQEPTLNFGAVEQPANQPQPEPLSPAQELLKKAQELVEEENRLKAQQAQQEAEQAQRANQPLAGFDPSALAAIESRMNAAEQKVNTLLTFFTQTYQALQELSPVETEPTAEGSDTLPPTTRTLLLRLVNSFAAADRRTEHEVWKYLYGQFDLRYDFNVYTKAVGKGERGFLGIIEKHGQLDNLYGLAKKLLVLPELK